MKKIIMFLFITLSSLCFLTSCGTFFSEEELMISSITSKMLDDGSTKLIINYTDETKTPDEFIIPRGLTGNGIKEIKTSKGEKEGTTIVEVIYTDMYMSPVTFEVKDGKDITGVSTKIDEETGEMFLMIQYSDGTSSEPILLPKGEKGEDGDGFAGYDYTANDDGSQTYIFHFTKSPDVEILIPAPEKGNGIKTITSDETDDEYILIIEYTDERENDVIKFKRPSEPNAWYSGSKEPDRELGRDGDYYMDYAHKAIWYKSNGTWSKVVNYDDGYEEYTITFDLNDKDDGGKQAQMVGYNVCTGMKRNTYFWQNGYDKIPVPTREGYKFVGWYRSKVVMDPTYGAFNDFTVILSDLTLYAIWEKVE